MDELRQLKELLLGEEKQSLDQIQHRLDDDRLRAEELAEVLPQAIRWRADKDRQLSQALQQPVEECLRDAIHKDTSSFADLLFPVMGPAIRRAITETLRGMLQAINKTLDESFSLRGLSWRIESMRSGVPFYDIVLRNTLLYRVEQLFLIQPGSGLLMQHMTAPDVPVQDPDAVSAMLTAVQDFAADSFSRGSGREALESLDMGDHTLWLFHGPHAQLAAVIRGLPPHSLRARFREALEQLHRFYHDELARFDGDRAPLYPAESILTECFVAEEKERTGNRGSVALPLTLIILFLAGLLAWLGYSAYVTQQREDRLVTTLNGTPGIVVLDTRYADGKLVVRGLRDPFGEIPAEAISAIGYDNGNLSLEWHDYQSADPQLALRRAQAMLAPPGSVDLALDNGTLLASGFADAAWSGMAESLSRLIPGIDRFDGSALRLPDELLLQRIIDLLQPPPSIRLSLSRGELEITGEAPHAWLAGVRPRLTDLADLREIRIAQARPSELRQIEQLRTELEQHRVYFTRGEAGLEGRTEELGRITQLIGRLFELHQTLNETCRIRIEGFTDGTGNMLLNQELARQRADAVKQWLTAEGIDPQLLETAADISSAWSDDETQGLEKLRRAEFRLISDLDSLPAAGE